MDLSFKSRSRSGSRNQIMLKITPQVGRNATSFPPTFTTRMSSSVISSRMNSS